MYNDNGSSWWGGLVYFGFVALAFISLKVGWATIIEWGISIICGLFVLMLISHYIIEAIEERREKKQAREG